MIYQQPAYINKLPQNGGYSITTPSGQVGLLKPTGNGNFIYIPPVNSEIDHPEQPEINEFPPPMFNDQDDDDSNGDN